MASKPTKKSKQLAVRVILSMSGEGMLRSWMTFQVPTWFVMAILFGFMLFVIAVLASPETAAKLAFALIQLAHLLSQSTK